MESIEQPFDRITHLGQDNPETRDKVELIDSDDQAPKGNKYLFNGDSPRAENSPLHQSKKTNSLLLGPQNHGLRVIILSSVVFAVAVTVALILTIYLKPDEVHGHASVACDDTRCSEMGLKILKHGGNAVDAAVTVAFCLGVVDPAHSGIGGGGFAIVHDHKYMKGYSYDFREVAPAGLTTLTEADELSVISTGVPGMVKGLYKMHNEHGSIPWKDLLTPSVELADEEYSVSPELVHITFPKLDPADFQGTALGELLLRADGTFKTTEDNMTFPAMARTLERLQGDPDSLYTGSLGDEFVEEIQKLNGLITKGDLVNYTINSDSPISSKFKDWTVLSSPPPSSGAVTAMILNIVTELGWTKDMESDPILYHELIETFRYAFAHLSLLGDPKFNPGMSENVKKLTNVEAAKKIAELIKKDNKTYTDPAHYGPSEPQEQHGTTHLSVFDSSELMVGITLSTNFEFGNRHMLNSGIVLNNQLMDFDLTPNSQSLNKPQPGKRPLSFMVPTVVYNKDHPCDLRIALGGMNASRILTGVSEVLVNSMVFNMNISDAISKPRIHNELGNTTYYEKGFPSDIVEALADMGHNPVQASEFLGIVNAIEKTNDNLFGYSDPRSLSKAAYF